MLNRWSDADAAGLSGADLVAYTSRLIGADEALVVWGGGNSSIKHVETDHRGRPVRVMRVKGSGSDMKTLAPKDLPGLRMDDIEAVFEREAMTDEEMVDYLALCKLEPNSSRPSIETLLHGFVPFDHVYHTHADAIAAITDTPNSESVVQEIYGDEVAWIPYLRPGFALSKLVGTAVRNDPDLEGVILDKHGIITWGTTAKQAYDRMIDLVGRAEAYLARRTSQIPLALGEPVVEAVPAGERPALVARVAPLIRGTLSRSQRQIVILDDSDQAIRFSRWGRVGEVSQLGPATPDHLLYTKQRALVLDPGQLDANSIRAAVDRYAEEYRAYFEQYRSAPNLTMLDPYPRTVIVPGLGVFHAGKDARAATVIRDIYRRSMAVMEGASSISAFQPIGVQHICDFEYWPLENYKLSLLPPEKELSRRTALVTGAASGIGRAIAEALHAAGACVAIADVDGDGARALAARLSAPNPALTPTAIALECDVRDEASVIGAFQRLVGTWGGLDILVPNAGIARSAAIDAMSLDEWERVMDVNATGYFLTLREGLRLMKAQAIGGTVVVVASKNVFAPGKDFAAYSASKAAEVQLARIAAIEGAEYGVRVNCVNPDGIFGDSRLWTDGMKEQRATTYGIEPDQLEQFYAGRNLLRQPVTADDVAQAVLWLASDRSAKTTGAVIPVDAGVPAAFPR